MTRNKNNHKPKEETFNIQIKGADTETIVNDICLYREKYPKKNLLSIMCSYELYGKYSLNGKPYSFYLYEIVKNMTYSNRILPNAS